MGDSARNANFRAYQAVVIGGAAILAWLGCAVASFRIVSRALRAQRPNATAFRLARRADSPSDLGGVA